MSETRKRWPVLTIAAVLLPAICAAVAFSPSTSTVSSGSWGLGELFLFAVLLLSGAVLGALLALLALLRREPWRPLQAIVLLANVGFLLYFGVPLLREKPAPSVPMGEPAYLTLAPAAERVTPQAIVLAYPAPSPEAERGYVIGQRDSTGVLTSLRTADWAEPLQPGEVRLQLNVVGGRWALNRTGDYIRKLPDERWRLGTYVELRVTQQGWGVPIGITDRSFWPLDSPR